MFKVYVDSEIVKVFKGNNQYLVVKRKMNWKLFLTFFKDSEIILKITINHILFKTFISIKNQSLTPTFNISWKRDCILTTGQLRLSLKTHWFKNPVVTIHNYGETVGKVSTKLGLGIGTTVYDVELNCPEEDEIFYLIVFIIALPIPV